MQSIIIHLLFHKLVGPAKETELSYVQSTADAVLMYVLSLFLGNCLYYLGENEEGDPHWEGEGWGADGSPCWPLCSQEDDGQDQPTLLLEGNYQRCSGMGKWSICSSCVWSRSALIFPALRHMRFNTRNAGPFLLTTSATRGVKWPLCCKGENLYVMPEVWACENGGTRVEAHQTEVTMAYDWWDILLLGSVKCLQPLKVIV